MLVIPFWVGEHAYGVAAEALHAVLPRPRLRPVPGGPRGLLGVFAFRGRWTPVVDAQLLLGGTAATAALATRLLLCRMDGDGATLGLLCERVTDALSLPDADWAPSGVHLDAAPWLGPLQQREGLTIQRLHIPHLLTPELRAAVCTLEPPE